MKYTELITTYLRDDKLLVFPARRKPRVACLIWLSKYFKTNVIYTETQVNDIIKAHTLFSDHEFVRRELIMNKILGREKDGSKYWKEKKQPKFDEYGFMED